MSNIVQISDFEGFYYIATSGQATVKFQNSIDYWENYYLTQLMGIELRDLYIADLTNGVPTDSDYLEIYNEFQEKQWNGCNNEMMFSKGLKELILGLVYYHYVGLDNTRHTLTGLVNNDNENSTLLSNLNVSLFVGKRYNEVVDTYNLISQKIVKLKLYDTQTEINYILSDLI